MPPRSKPLSQRPKQTGASLNEAATRLKNILGDAAPSRITLHRHSAAGDLSAAVVRRSKSRAYYDIETLAEHYRPRGLASPGKQESMPTAAQAQPYSHALPTKPAPQATAPAPAPLIDAKVFAQALVKEVAPLIDQQVASSLKPIAALMARLDGGLSDLAATRTTLMLKYDAVAALSDQRLEAAKSELARLKASETIDVQISRMRIDLSRMVEAIARLEALRTNS